MSKVKDQDIFTFILMQEDRRGKVQFKTVFPVWGGGLEPFHYGASSVVNWKLRNCPK